VEDDPDRRQAIIDGTFQQQTCVRCDTRFRPQPDFSYTDIQRGQWILAFPREKLPDAPECEDRGRDIFAELNGADVPPHALAQSAGLTARITFGWTALKEKIIAAEAQLSDVALELWKIELLRNQQPPEHKADELRLQEIDGEHLVMAWIADSDSEEVVELISYPRSDFSDFNLNRLDLQELPQRFAGRLFVDRSWIGTEVP
jgi:hypothetical protein